MTRSKNWIFYLLLLPIAVLSIGHFIWASYNTRLIGFADIDVFLYSVLNYLHSGSLYLDREPLSLTYEAGRSVLKFPPLYVVPYLPWLKVGADIQSSIYPNIYNMLFSLHVIRYVVALCLFGYFVGPHRNPLWWAVLIIVFSMCAPFYEALYGLTFDNLYLFILVISLVLIKYKQEMVTASLLMYAANAKLYPFLQLIQFFSSKNWKMVFYCGVATCFWIGLSLYFFGLAQHEFYYFKIIPVLLQETVLCETGNLSLAAQLCRVDLSLIWFKVGFVLATAAISFFVSRKKKLTFESESLLFSLVICLPLLIMQNVWGNYQMVLLVPICVLISYSFNRNSLLDWLPGFLALLAWLPLIVSDNYPSMNMPYYLLLDDKFVRLMIDGLKPFSVLLLWITLVGVLLFGKKVAR